MKKQLLFLTAIFLFSLATYSQVLISEDFNGTTIPTGWMTGANSGSQSWTFGSGVVPGGVADFSTNAAIFSDDAAGDTGDHNDAYLGPSDQMDLSIYDNTLYDLRLKYDYAFNDVSGEKLLVNVYHNYAWYNIIEYTANADSTNEVLNISDYFVDDFVFVFKYDDVDGAWGWGAGIDNVELRVMPKNDSCINAFNVSTLPYTQSLNAEGATNNDGFILYEGVGMNDGVWYKFVGNGGEYEINVDPTGWDPEIAVLTGSCGSMTKVANVDNAGNGASETVTFTSVAGTTYYVNVGYYSYQTDGAEGPFDIQIQNINLPANDECANATNLTVGNIMATHTVGTLVGATDVDANNYIDVWYKATVPTSGNITFETYQASGSPFDDTFIKAFSGSCGSLSFITNDSNGGTDNFSKIELTGQTPGDIIYFNVEKTSHSTPSGEFEVLAYEPPPVNDECANAINLTVGNSFNENAVEGTLAGSTSTGTSYTYPQVWYTATIPASGNLTIETGQAAGSPMNDTFIRVSSGTCGSLSEISHDDDGGDGSFSKIVLTGRTPGETITIEVDKAQFEDELSTFMISAYISNDATLSALTYDGTSVLSFDAGTYTYNVELAAGTTVVPTVEGTPTDANATAVTTNATALPGSSSVLVTAQDGTTTLTYTINFTVATSINMLNAENISIYPNPANDFLKISSELNIETISIFDISGKELININTNSNNTEVNVSNLKAGIYFIRIANKDGVFQSKFVKK